jgi:predicted metal-dependent phosphoesterase TrpH
MRKADLHTHSTVSDGRLSPTALIEMGASLGLLMMALTDHDNIGGLREAEVAGRRLGVEIIPGVEISADYEPGTMHILGLGLDSEHEGLLRRLDYLQTARRERNPKVIQRLRTLGVDISLAEVEALAGGRQIGRPHFAQALIQKGVAKDFDDAFERFLGKGAPAYVPKLRLAPAEAIRLIHDAGGVAVLAHPIQLQLEAAPLERLLEKLSAEDGLDALEAYHSDHSDADTKRYLELAQRHQLKVSGGSDFHGIPKRRNQLGEPGLELELARKLLAERS